MGLCALVSWRVEFLNNPKRSAVAEMLLPRFIYVLHLKYGFVCYCLYFLVMLENKCKQ